MPEGKNDLWWPMNFSKISSLLLLTLFDWELASQQRECDEIKSMLLELKQIARNLQQRAMATDDSQAQRIIKQKQQIIHVRRSKTLALLRECNRRRRQRRA
ncbi:MAG: hypothetical protein U9N50_04765 [Pseudomonadota bacterium]|nr:hypothetical protein [Pseudomonadota bacterium]